MKYDTTFSIENDINPETQQPFGPKYAGTFSIRRPSLQDKTRTSIKVAASLSASGIVDINFVSGGVLAALYLFAQVEQISTDTVPVWFDMNKVYDDDEPAIQAVSNEVSSFINSFKSKPAPTQDGQPAA